MATTVETISGDRRIQLANEEWVRKMSFGANWSKLRVTVRVSINGTANITTPGLFIGICSGLTHTYKSTITDFWFGLRVPGVNAGVVQNLNYNAGPPAWYQSSSAIGFSTNSRLNNTSTPISGIGQTTFIASTANNPPSVIGFEVVRTGSVYWMPNFFTPATQAQVQAGNTQRQMLVGMDSESGTPWDSVTTVSLSAQLIGTNAVSDSHLCDCVSVYWDQTTPTAEISDIQVTRFY